MLSRDILLHCRHHLQTAELTLCQNFLTRLLQIDHTLSAYVTYCACIDAVSKMACIRAGVSSEWYIFPDGAPCRVDPFRWRGSEKEVVYSTRISPGGRLSSSSWPQPICLRSQLFSFFGVPRGAIFHMWFLRCAAAALAPRSSSPRRSSRHKHLGR